MKKLLALLCSLTLLTPMSAFSVGAIAVDDVEGDRASDVGYYVVTGEDSEAAAKNAALRGCRNEGMKNCRIGVWFTRCGAYATSPSKTGWGTGSSKAQATENALEGCGAGCKLVIAECE